MGIFDRTEIVLGKENIEKLQNSKVIIFGIGGVGGYVSEMLARTGVGNITLVDFDIVGDTNINRQIVALNSTVGVKKIQVMKNRINDINKNINVEIIDEKLLPENIEKFCLNKFDYVIDCIDTVKSKVALIKYCFDNKIKLISSMGTGNRNGVPNFEICDIYQTKNDGLARVLRRELKKLNVENAMVVYSTNQPVSSKIVGSVAYYPTICGCLLSAYVIDDLIK